MILVALLWWAGSYTDPVTGLEIRQLTEPGQNATNLYYHFSNFTADNSHVIIAVDGQVARYEVASGKLQVLTDAPGVAAAAACPHPVQSNLVYFFQGADLIEMDIFTRARRRVGTMPPAAVGGYGQPTFSHDLTEVTVSRQRDAENWEVGLMNVATGAYRTVVSTGFRVGHVQHSPTDPLIFYVWETGGYAPQRSWVVKPDGTANRPFYARTDPKTWFTPLKEWLTHEAFIANTSQMTMIMDKVGILLVERDGSNRMLAWGNYWHVAARPDGKYLVADDFDGRLWLIEAATGNTRLLVTGVRRNNRATHAHASFDRVGKWVLFNNSYQYDTVSLVAVPE
jgi:hypothetical protein